MNEKPKLKKIIEERYADRDIRRIVLVKATRFISRKNGGAIQLRMETREIGRCASLECRRLCWYSPIAVHSSQGGRDQWIRAGTMTAAAPRVPTTKKPISCRARTIPSYLQVPKPASKSWRNANALRDTGFFCAELSRSKNCFFDVLISSMSMPRLLPERQDNRRSC